MTTFSAFQKRLVKNHDVHSGDCTRCVGCANNCSRRLPVIAGPLMPPTVRPGQGSGRHITVSLPEASMPFLSLVCLRPLAVFARVRVAMHSVWFECFCMQCQSFSSDHLCCSHVTLPQVTFSCDNCDKRPLEKLNFATVF